MGKNIKGGSKHKKFARKNGKGNYSGFDEHVRKPTHPDEIYASVTKILGNGRVEILCNDGKLRLCIIGGKFRGKNKRNNELTIGSVILAGRRSWETPNDTKKETCDLLVVYNISQINKLKTDPNVNMTLLQSASNTAFNKDVQIDFFDRGMPEEMESIKDNDNEDNEHNDQCGVNDQDNKDVLSLMNKNEDIVNVDDI